MPKKLTQEEFEERLKNYTNDTVELITPYVNKRTKVIIKCKKCGYEWEKSPQGLCPSSQYNFEGCPQCNHENSFIEYKCDYCGKIFKRQRKDFKYSESGFHYCSKECGNRHKNQLRKEAGEWDNSLNYRLRAFEVYPHECLCCGWDEDDRILEVHHIDEDHKNNDINNLCILCPICHRKITLGYYYLDLENKQLIER